MNKELVFLKKLIGKGTNIGLREEALRVANRTQSIKELNEVAKGPIDNRIKYAELEIPEFLLKIQNERQNRRAK